MRLAILLLTLSFMGSVCRSEETAPPASADADPPFVYEEAGNPFRPEPASAEREAANEKLRFPISPEERKKTGGRLVAGKISGATMTVSFLNDSEETVYIDGGGFRSPHYTPLILRGGRWEHSPNHMNCGTGAYTSPLRPGYGFSFLVKIPPGPESFRLRMQTMSAVDSQGRRRATEIQMPPLDPVKALIRDSDSIVNIAIYEEELVTVMWEKAEEEDLLWEEEDHVKESMLVKRAVVTEVYKGDMKPGDKVEYVDLLDYPINAIRKFRSVVEGEPKTLFLANDVGSLKNGTHVMKAEGHRSFNRVKGTMADVLRNELAENPEFRHSAKTDPPPAPEFNQTENVQAYIRENDFIADICVYEVQWTPPTEKLPKAIYTSRAVVTGVHKGDIPVGTLLEYSSLIEDPPKYIPAFRSVVEGKLKTIFFSEQYSTVRDGKYTIELRSQECFDRLEGDFADSFAAELMTNPELRGSYRRARNGSVKKQE